MGGRWSVTTCNVRHGVPWGRSHTQLLVPWLDNRRLVRRVSALDADLVALQEVDRRVLRSWGAHQAARCAAGLGARGVFGPARRMWPGGRYGNALLVRGEVTEARNVALSSVGEPRAAVFARVRLGDRGAGPLELTAVSTHLQNRHRDRPDEAVDQLEELLVVLSGWPRPWVVAGDLNLGPDRVERVLAAAGLVPVDTAATHPTDRPRTRIDWIAASGVRLEGPRTSEVVVADHRAVSAELVPLDG